MNRALPIVGLLAAAALAAFLLLRGSADEPEAASRKGAPVAGAPSPGTEPSPSSPQTRPTLPPAPTRLSGEPVGTEPTLRYRRNDGTEVRDHRAQPAEPQLDREVKLPAKLSKVKPITVATVRRSVRPAMKGCIESFRQGKESGEKAQAVLKISIAEEQMTVNEVDVQSSDVKDHEGFATCVREALEGHEEAIVGAGDVEDYTLTFPYDFSRPY